MSDELLPCPFCGEPAEMDTRQSFRSVFTGEMLEQVSIYCTSCSAEISHYPGDLSMCRESVIELCIDAWNNRATIDLAAEREAAARDALEAAAEVCLEQQQVFLSPKYAAQQPMSSIGERLACARCSEEIRAIDPAQFREVGNATSD